MLTLYNKLFNFKFLFHHIWIHQQAFDKTVTLYWHKSLLEWNAYSMMRHGKVSEDIYINVLRVLLKDLWVPDSIDMNNLTKWGYYVRIWYHFDSLRYLQLLIPVNSLEVKEI